MGCRDTLLWGVHDSNFCDVLKFCRISDFVPNMLDESTGFFFYYTKYLFWNTKFTTLFM